MNLKSYMYDINATQITSGSEKIVILFISGDINRQYNMFINLFVYISLALVDVKFIYIP